MIRCYRSDPHPLHDFVSGDPRRPETCPGVPDPDWSEPPPTSSQKGALLLMQEQIAPVIAAFTGVRAQLIEQGWSPANAEQMTIELVRLQRGGAS